MSAIQGGHATCHHTCYLLTCESFSGLLARANDCCEICRTPSRETATGKLLIDHDHALGIGAVRGLVCPGCNHLLGRVDAGAIPPDHLAEAVAAYLANPWVTDPPPDPTGRVYRPRAIDPDGMPVAEARRHFADVVNAAIRGQITYITSRGRRVAAVVPVPVAEAAEESGQG